MVHSLSIQGFFKKCGLGGEIAFLGRKNENIQKIVIVWGGGEFLPLKALKKISQYQRS